jgi:hypothetical protein
LKKHLYLPSHLHLPSLPLLPGAVTRSRSSSARAARRVYLAHDITLDRDVAFAMIKTEKLDELVSGHYPFDKINKAIASMEKGGVIRNVIMF